MSLFVGHIVRTIETPGGREAIVSVRGAHCVVVLDAVPHARRGDAVLVEAGVALAIVRGDGPRESPAPQPAGGVRHVAARDVNRRSADQEGAPCA